MVALNDGLEVTARTNFKTCGVCRRISTPLRRCERMVQW